MPHEVTRIRLHENGREHHITVQKALGPAERRALADRFGLEEGVDVWFEEAWAEGDPGRSGVITLSLPDSARKSG